MHGTGDTAAGPDGEKWFQTRSAFVARLQERLAAAGLSAEIDPFLWSGANSARAREKASADLAKGIRRKTRTRGAVHLVGHSHGGNVVNESARLLRWRPRFNWFDFLLNPASIFPSRDRIASVTTVGTPFFRSSLTTGEALGGAAFLIMAFISTVVLLGIALFMLAQIDDTRMSYDQWLAEANASAWLEPRLRETYAQGRFQDAQALKPWLPYWLGGALAGLVALFFVYRVAFSGVARIVRLRRKKNANANVCSIWHPNDEAISFLQRVEKLPFEAFPRGSFWRGSRTAGIVWGVQTAVWVAAIGLVMLAAGVVGVEFPDWFQQAFFAPRWMPELWDYLYPSLYSTLEVTPDQIGLLLVTAGIVGMPIIFAVVYLFARLIVFGLFLELGLRGVGNGIVSNALRGMAFGRDGDERIGDVATQSHCHGAHCIALDGEVAQRMQHGARGAADALLEKYRWALFSVSADSNEAMEALAVDAMTWDSLIHTTYFDQPEIADMIADHIIAEERHLAEQDAKARDTVTAMFRQLGPLAPKWAKAPAAAP
ncbi:MAG: hypothetical protein AB7P07_13480 [Hyphomonadaceae bacterium]